MKEKNQRDDISNLFETWKNVNDVDPVAADNILIAQPVIHDIISDNLYSEKPINILDYWCWAWWFMIDLAQKGNFVVWVDASNNMLVLANKNIWKLQKKYRKNIIATIFWDDTSLIKNPELMWKFDLITSIMALQFIPNEDIELTIQNISKWLKDNGMIIFAIRNKDRIKEGIEWYDRFKHLETLKDWTINCSVDFNWTWINSYNRTAEIYDNIFDWMWFEKIHQASPPFTKEFIEKYNRDDPYKNSEYLILAYRK